MSEGGKSQEAVSVILKRINFVTKFIFLFNDENYVQGLGTAMGTKMAKCYVSLIIGMLEMDFLGSCDKTPLIWLLFLGTFFMIWNHSEQDLHHFI